MKNSGLGLLLLFCLLSLNTYSQDTASLKTNANLISNGFKNSNLTQFATNFSSFGSNTSSVTALTSIQNKTTANATIAIPLDRINRNNMQISISTPFNGQNEVHPLDIDGLASSTSLGLNCQFYFTKPKPVDSISAKMDGFYKMIFKEREKVQSATLGKLHLNCKKDSCLLISELDKSQTYTNLTKPERKLLDSLIKDEVLKENQIKGNDWLWGLSFKISHNTYDYFKDTSLLKTTEQKLYNYSGKIYIGYINMTNKNKGSAAAFSIIYQSVYDPGKTNTYQVNVSKDASQQMTLGIGSPKLSNTITPKLEFRLLNSKYGAINPYIGYGINNLGITKGVLNIGMPVYFYKLKDNNKISGLDGGVFANFQDDIATHKTTFDIGIFLSTAFDITQF